MEMRGAPEDYLLEQSPRKNLFFDPETDQPFPVKNSRGKVRMPGSKSIASFLNCDSPTFVDFIERCLEWDPRKRISPIEALQHDWIVEGLPPEVLLYHQRMLGINLDENASTAKKGQKRNN